GDIDADLTLPEICFNEQDGFLHDLVDLKPTLSLVRFVKIPEIIDGLGHVKYNVHRPGNSRIEIFLTELTEFICQVQFLDGKTKSIEGLAPLVGDVADHLSHGGL